MSEISSFGANKERFQNEGDYAYQETPPHQLRKEVITKLVGEAIDPRSIWLNPNSHTLTVSEVGIGNGFLTNGYKGVIDALPFPSRITGIDLTPKLLSGLKQNGTINDGIVSLAEQVPLPDRSQNLVVMSEVLEHTRTPKLSLDEIHRVLTDGGKFIGSVPNMAQLWDRIGMLRGDAPHQVARKVDDQTFTHESHFTVNLLREALQKAGFSDVDITTNLVRLLREDDGQTFPAIREFLAKKVPGLGDRLIWTARKEPGTPVTADNLPTVYLVSGAPRTGKSTLSHELAERKQAAVVSISDIRMQQTNHAPQFIPQELEHAYTASVDAVDASLQAGKNVVWEGTFRSKESREKIKALIRRHPAGYRIVPVELRAPSLTVQQRVQETQATHVDRDVTPERAKQLAETHPTLPGAFTYDTATLSPAQLADTIAAI